MAARPLVARQTNQRLRSLIQEASLSNSALARQVNVLGEAQGLDLRYDKTSVSRWLSGQRPRGRVPAIIAEALSGKLGRTVSTEEIGMANGNSVTCGVGLHFAATVEDALEQVRELWHMDAESRGLLSRSAMTASALVEPSRDWLISSRTSRWPATGGWGRGWGRAMWSWSGRPPGRWPNSITGSAADMCDRSSSPASAVCCPV